MILNRLTLTPNQTVQPYKLAGQTASLFTCSKLLQSLTDALNSLCWRSSQTLPSSRLKYRPRVPQLQSGNSHPSLVIAWMMNPRSAFIDATSRSFQSQTEFGAYVAFPPWKQPQRKNYTLSSLLTLTTNTLMRWSLPDSSDSLSPEK